MSDGNAPFVEKALQYARTNSELIPSYVKVDEMEIDIKVVNDLTQLLRLADMLCGGLNDAIMLSGSAAYVAALAFYKAVKAAASMNVAGTQRIYEDLSKRFEGQGRTSSAPANTQV